MMFIIEVSEGANVFEMDSAILEAVQAVGAQWPESSMPSTQVINGRQVVLIYADASKADIEALIAAFSLDWIVLACEGEQVSQAALLPFYLDTVLYDDEGNVAGSEPVTDLTGMIQTFAGRSWNY